MFKNLQNVAMQISWGALIDDLIVAFWVYSIFTKMLSPALDRNN